MSETPVSMANTVVAANTFPRRVSMGRWTPAERAIYDAAQVVEAMGADLRLTDAVVLLGAARDRVADFVDGVEGSRWPFTPAIPPAPPPSDQPVVSGPLLPERSA